MNIPSFLILDSGIGGLSVLQEIRKRIPQCHTCYVADNGGFPYGSREEASLVLHLLQLLPSLVEEYQPDIVIIACNTASTAVLTHLREKISIPIIGVVPAIKPAAIMSQTNHIALLATAGTLERPYTQGLIKDFASNCSVLKVCGNALVHEAENKLRQQSVNNPLIQRILSPVIASNSIDTLILACTHFPFLRSEIEDSLPQHITVIDSGQAIARRTEQLLLNMAIPARPSGEDTFLFTQSLNNSNPQPSPSPITQDTTTLSFETAILQLGFKKIRFIPKINTQN